MMTTLVHGSVERSVIAMSILANCIGLAGKPPISLQAAIILLNREGGIRRCEARVAVLDYLGWQREDICEELGVTVGTIDTYWKRIYRATGRHSREAARAWVEELLSQDGVE
jgi:DNA-binding NarL/FixJ family response regulator